MRTWIERVNSKTSDEPLGSTTSALEVLDVDAAVVVVDEGSLRSNNVACGWRCGKVWWQGRVELVDSAAIARWPRHNVMGEVIQPRTGRLPELLAEKHRIVRAEHSSAPR